MTKTDFSTSFNFKIILKLKTDLNHNKTNLTLGSLPIRNSTLDAVATLVHIISKHLDKPTIAIRTLFLGFSSAFNTIQVDILVSELVQLGVNSHLICW